VAYIPKKLDRYCVVCGESFPPVRNRTTCGDECSAARRASYLSKWRASNADANNEKAKRRRERDIETARTRNRDYMREQRGTDAAKFLENRDPEAMKERERERWRRGQARRRERVRA